MKIETATTHEYTDAKTLVNMLRSDGNTLELVFVKSYTQTELNMAMKVEKIGARYTITMTNRADPKIVDVLEGAKKALAVFMIEEYCKDCLYVQQVYSGSLRF